MSGLVAVTRDLMDASRIRSAVPAVTVVSDIGGPDLAEAGLIALDLAAGIDPAAAAAIGPPVVAYGPHVDSEALAAAVAAGCADALPRSVFFRRLPVLLAEHGSDPIS